MSPWRYGSNCAHLDPFGRVEIPQETSNKQSSKGFTTVQQTSQKSRQIKQGN